MHVEQVSMAKIKLFVYIAVLVLHLAFCEDQAVVNNKLPITIDITNVHFNECLVCFVRVMLI